MAERLKFRKDGVDLQVICRSPKGLQSSRWFKFRTGDVDVALYQVPLQDPQALPDLLVEVARFKDKYHLGPRQLKRLDWVTGCVESTIRVGRLWPEDY